MINIKRRKCLFHYEDSTTKLGAIIDKYYQSPFWITKSNKKSALYGKRNDVHRIDYRDFYSTLKISGSIRAKSYSIPVVEVNNIEEIRRICNSVPIVPFTSSGVYYRGQTSAFHLQRLDAVKELLFGNTDIVEPSLVGAAQRRGINYEDVHSLLSVLTQDFIFQNNYTKGKNLDELHKTWFDIASSPSGDWDHEIMALAQHYGLPTHGLDVTSDINVALWFATHKLNNNNDGTFSYVKLKEEMWPENAQLWPSIYIIQTANHSLSTSIRKIDTLASKFGLMTKRPVNQSGYFFMGSQSLHQNRLAECLVLQIRLAPSDYETGLTQRDLFPGPEEDEAYSFMLQIKEKYKSGRYAEFFSEIIEFN